MSEKLRVSNQDGQPEIFNTIQGEGRNMGEPATFMRLSGCNLQCVWCDTPYTWNWNGTSFEHHKGVKYDRDEQTLTLDVGQAVDRITGFESSRVVITGGEPLLQQANLLGVVEALRQDERDFRVEIETNGTVMPRPALVEQVDRFNVSPKLSNSGMDKDKRYKPEVLRAYAEMKQADFKFVVDTPGDVAEVMEIIEEAGMPNDRVYLMPQGVSQAEQVEKEQWVAELCKIYQFNYTPRLHINLWGDKRGV